MAISQVKIDITPSGWNRISVEAELIGKFVTGMVKGGAKVFELRVSRTACTLVFTPPRDDRETLNVQGLAKKYLAQANTLADQLWATR